MLKQPWRPRALLAGAALLLIGIGSAEARSLAVSPDGRLVATVLPDPAGREGKGLRLGVYDARTGELVRQVGSWLPRDSTVIAFSPDGSRLLSTRPSTPCDDEGRCPGFDEKQVMIVETRLDSGEEAEIALVPGRISAVSYDTKGSGVLAIGGAGLYSASPGQDAVLLQNADFSARSSTVSGSVSDAIFLVSQLDPRHGRRDDLDEPVGAGNRSSFDYPARLLSSDTAHRQFFPIGRSLRERKAYILDISPDGRRILVRARVGDGSALLRPHQFAEELFLIEDGRERRLTRVCGSLSGASLSPDGRKVVVRASAAVISSDEITPDEILVADVGEALARGGIMPRATGILARREGRTVADAQSRWDRARCSPNRPEPPAGRITGAALAGRIGALSRLESLGDAAGIKRSLRVRFDANTPLNDQVFVGEDIAPRRRAIGEIGFEKTSGRMFTLMGRSGIQVTQRYLSVDLRASGPCMTVQDVERVLGNRHHERAPETPLPPWMQPRAGADYPPLVRPPFPRTSTDALVYELGTNAGQLHRTLTVNFRNARCAESFSVQEKRPVPLLRGAPEMPPARRDGALPDRGSASGLSLTPDGTYVAVTYASTRGGGFAVVDARTGRLVGVRDFPDTDVVKVAVSADGRRALVYRTCSHSARSQPGMCGALSRRISEIDLGTGLEIPILDNWTTEDVQGGDQYRPFEAFAVAYDGRDPERILVLSAGERQRSDAMQTGDYFQIVGFQRTAIRPPRILASWDAPSQVLASTPAFTDEGTVSLLVNHRDAQNNDSLRMTSLSPDGSVVAMPVPVSGDGKPMRAPSISSDGRRQFGGRTEVNSRFQFLEASSTTGEALRVPENWRQGRFVVHGVAISSNGRRVATLSTDLAEGDAMMPRLMIASLGDGMEVVSNALAEAELGRRQRSISSVDLLRTVKTLVDGGIGDDLEAMAKGLGARLIPTRANSERTVEELSTGVQLGTVRNDRNRPSTLEVLLYNGECITAPTARAVLGSTRDQMYGSPHYPRQPWSDVGSIEYSSPSGYEISVSYSLGYCAGRATVRKRIE